jgi:putative endonuclease
VSTKARGDEAEGRALAWLQARGWCWCSGIIASPAAHARAARDRPRHARPGGHARFRRSSRPRRREPRWRGGECRRAKQRSLLFAAQHFLQRYASPPACRFDVLAVDGDRLDWLQAAFDAS